MDYLGVGKRRVEKSKAQFCYDVCKTGVCLVQQKWVVA